MRTMAAQTDWAVDPGPWGRLPCASLLIPTVQRPWFSTKRQGGEVTYPGSQLRVESPDSNPDPHGSNVLAPPRAGLVATPLFCSAEPSSWFPVHHPQLRAQDLQRRPLCRPLTETRSLLLPVRRFLPRLQPHPCGSSAGRVFIQVRIGINEKLLFEDRTRSQYWPLLAGVGESAKWPFPGPWGCLWERRARVVCSCANRGT